MSYKYEFKEYIRDEILSNINHMNILDDALDELDHVYAQATKADEYEAKAKAFDEICKAHVPLEKRMSPVTIDEGLDFAEETEEIILKYYESGEPNEL